MLAGIMHLSVVLVFLAVLLMKVCEMSVETCSSVGFGEETGAIFLFFLIFTTVIIFGALLIGLYTMAVETANTVPVLLKRSNAQPVLLRPPSENNLKYHLFLSHVWSTGQDQAALIKRQLQLCLPGAVIFLDVDDLTDIANLEEHVAQSGVLALLLTQGYFLSRNCLRELRAAYGTRKPLVLVHEGNASRGGLSLDDSRKECPDDLCDYVFSNTVIPWYRLQAFQRHTLKLMANVLLEHCAPAILESDDIYFKGEVTASKIKKKMHGQITFRVSNFNSGVDNIATALEAVSPSFIRKTGIGSNDLPTNEVVVLYLNALTFTSQSSQHLALELMRVLRARSRLVVVHENDEALGGCAFDMIMATAPAQLIDAGLFSFLAVPLHPHPFRELSVLLAALELTKVMNKKIDRRFGLFLHTNSTTVRLHVSQSSLRQAESLGSVQNQAEEMSYVI